MANYYKATNKGKGVVVAEGGNNVIDGRKKGDNTIYTAGGINIISTSSANDTVFGQSGKNFISVGDGKNTVYAGGGNRILAGADNDKIFIAKNSLTYSGSGDDTIQASQGSNVINTGTGRDKVFLGGGNNRVMLEAGDGSVTINGFDLSTDKLRLGESLLGKSIQFVKQGADTIVKSGDDTLATLKGVKGSATLIDKTPLYTYTTTDLGSLRTDPKGSVESVNAASINDFGQIAGRYNTGATFSNQNTATPPVTNNANPVRQGFIWENGTFKSITSTGIKNGESDFGAKDGQTVTLLTPNVNTISNLGTILGTADEVRQPVGLPTDRALVWEQNSDGYSLTINDFGGKESYFFDVNNSNTIVGRNILSDGFEKTIYSDNGVIKDLANRGGDGGTARGLNNQGQIVGYVDSDGKLDDKFVNTAVIWQKDDKGDYQFTDLGTFGAAQATLRDINDAGQIVGSTSNGLSGADAASNPFILRDTNGNGKYELSEVTNLGSLGGKTGSVNGINELGQVVGSSADKDGKNRAFVWTDGTIADLNSLVSAPLTYNGAAVTLTSAAGINNFGDITALGTYTYKDSAGKDATGTRSYLLSGLLLGEKKSAPVTLDAASLAKVVSGDTATPTPNLTALTAKSVAAAPVTVSSGISAASGASLPLETPIQPLTTAGIAATTDLNARTMLGTEPSPLTASVAAMNPLPLLPV
jgi:probable HAF family extracellular repeat protein